VILTSPAESIARWVFAQIRDEADSEGFFALPYWAMGFCDASGAMRGGIVYHTHRGTTLEAIAAGLPGWLTPERTRAMFAYGFDTLDCRIIISHAARANRRSRRLLQRLGFSPRGCIPRAIHDRKAAVIYSMHRDDCRWLQSK
jgi:hypothetical protein